MRSQLIVTCEHGGNTIPQKYRDAFANADQALCTHRGWDPGALNLAKQISRYWASELHSSTTSRLLVDLNRSMTHSSLFSEWSRQLSPGEQEQILAQYYHPYRARVTECVKQLVNSGKQVVHLSVHSFTPIFNGHVRSTDIGLLHDPHRQAETEFVINWRKQLHVILKNSMVIHRNRPYRGTSDGVTTALRKSWNADRYLGIELEVSHNLLATPNSFPKSLALQLASTLPL